MGIRKLIREGEMSEAVGPSIDSLFADTSRKLLVIETQAHKIGESLRGIRTVVDGQQDVIAELEAEFTPRLAKELGESLLRAKEETEELRGELVTAQMIMAEKDRTIAGLEMELQTYKVIVGGACIPPMPEMPAMPAMPDIPDVVEMFSPFLDAAVDLLKARTARIKKRTRARARASAKDKK
jgi:hypothetical protein